MTETSATGTVSELAVQRRLTTAKIAGLVLAFLTPLVTITASFPLLFAFGGPSAAYMILACAAIMFVFLWGYVRMARRIQRPGGFYAYIGQGLGRALGGGAAMIAVIGYTGGLIAMFAVQPVLFRQTLLTFGLDIDWRICLVVMLVLIGVLAWRDIDLNAKIIGAVVVCEYALVLVLLGAIIARNGAGAFDPAVFDPAVFLQGSWMVGFIYAFQLYQGFESGALYAPEAVDPAKQVPRGLYVALGVGTTFMVVSAWVLISITGVPDLQEVLLSGDPAGYVFAIVADYLGPLGSQVFAVFVVVAAIACTLTFVNFASRYVQSLAGERLLPRALARKNRQLVPGTAILVLLGIVTVVDLGLSLTGLDPFTQMAPVFLGISVISAIAILVLASASVVGYFRRDRHGERWISVQGVPALATALLAAVLVIMLISFDSVTGGGSPWLSVLPIVVLAAFVGGIVFVRRLRARRPEVYAALAAGETTAELAEIRIARDDAAAVEGPAQ